MLATADARGLFIFVDPGRAGPLGGVFTYNKSQLLNKTEEHRLLNEQMCKVGDTYVRPYLVGDSAFAQPQTLVEGFPFALAPENVAFDAAVVSARKIVEQTFGRVKKKFKNHFSRPA